MFAFKAHNPYKQTWISDAEHLRTQIDELVIIQNESLEKCDEIERQWGTFKIEIAAQSTEQQPWYVKLYRAVSTDNGETPLAAIELYEKHVDELREKIQNFTDIKKVIVANLAHNDKRKAEKESADDPSNVEESFSVGTFLPLIPESKPSSHIAILQ